MNPTEPKPNGTPAPCTWAEFKSALETPVFVTVNVNGAPKTLALQRLTATQRSEVDEIYNVIENRSARLLPPRAKREGVGANTALFDENDEKYQRELRKLQRQARALAVYHGWSEFRTAASANGMSPANMEAMTLWIEEAMPETLLEAIFLRLLTDGLEISVGERVNFT